jgi:hypothetical protein
MWVGLRIWEWIWGMGYAHNNHQWIWDMHTIATNGYGICTQYPPMDMGYAHNNHQWIWDMHTITTNGYGICTQ